MYIKIPKRVNEMIGKGVQQLMLGKIIKSEEQAARTLETVRFSGYDGIELNGFMIRKTSLFVRALTAAAGMPAGRGGAYDWATLTRNAGLHVISLHEDLGTLQEKTQQVIETAHKLQTNNIVITGMYRFDYTDEKTLSGLCDALNQYGKRLREEGLSLLYHNHNAELCRVGDTSERAYTYLMHNTDPAYLNFEFDSYWFTEAGANAAKWMELLGTRMRLWHINDRGNRQKGACMTPILKSDSMELGSGNMDLDGLTAAAKRNNIEAVILESHRNHIDGDPIKSLQRSAAYLNRNFS